jgi:hypothetical protein
MRAREFILEDGFTPAQQAAQRAGMGTKAWVKGPTLSARSKIPYVGAVLSVNDAIDRWQAGDRTGAVISTLAAVGYIVPSPIGWVVATGLETVNSMRDSGLVQDPFRQPANQRPVGPETGKQPWEHPPMNEESASDINPNTGKPYTTDEWARYWNPGAGRPYTEKEKEMFADPDVTAKSVGKEVLRRIPGIGSLINIGDAVKGFRDISR